MATNQYFNKFSNSAEQRLVQDLVDEAIKINGVDMVYIPRSVMNEDEIFGEDRLPKFESGRQLEMYVESYDGYEGGGEQFSSIGLQIDDRMTVVVSRRRFLEVFADKNYSYPREGDLIYFPLNKDVFEINFVDREYNFFNFGKSMGYKIECSLFKYTGEDFDTGFDAVDGVTSAASIFRATRAPRAGAGRGATASAVLFAAAAGTSALADTTATTAWPPHDLGWETPRAAQAHDHNPLG